MGFRFYLSLFVISVVIFGTNCLRRNETTGSVLNWLPPLASKQCRYSPTIDCTNKRAFRTIDGSCNHEKAPYIGKSDTPYIRTKPANYIDNKFPRVKSYYGTYLPTPRETSLNFFRAPNNQPAPSSSKFNNVLAVFARFIEHDLYNTKLLEATDCCTTSKSTPGKCNNIELKPDDPFFGPFKRTCLPKSNIFVSPKLNCQDIIAEQVNENTHYLDLSNIYGSTDVKAKELREGKDGLLKVQLNDKDILLPKTDFKACEIKDKCFLAGDSRVNIDPLLMTMYTIWVRQHNDIAKTIKGINQKYTDEEIFQVTRKIVIAIYQHIVYSEFLPSINPNTKLSPPKNDYTSPQEAARPEIANYFSIAFTALADTLTQGEFISKKGDVKVKLEKSWYQPGTLWETDGVKILAEGMLKDKAGKYDRFVPKALHDEYLQVIYGQGTDKVSMNLQQSRENGIQTYYASYAFKLNNYRTFTYNDVTTFDAAIVPKLKSLYKHMYDIEFLPGLFGEKVISVTGPFMAEILEKQFENLRNGDEFFYSHKNIFDHEKLSEIKKTTMAAVMCKYAAMDRAPVNAFLPEASGTNDQKECKKILEKPNVIDICKWSTDIWSEWTDGHCQHGIKMKTRQCRFAPETHCECKGESHKFESCF